MHNKSKEIRLWTIQSIKSINELQETGKLLVKWDRYHENDYFKTAYEWMSTKMTKKGVICEDYAPIWLWYSINESKKKPTLKLARNLLSDIEIENGVKVIEILYPKELGIIYSNYLAWNKIIDKFIDDRLNPKIELDLEEELFRIEDEDELIQQATISILKRDWIVDIRELNLKPNNFDYKPSEEI